MPRSCELTGLGILTGNKVSHSNRKTRRKFLPNLQQITLFSDAMNQSMKFRIAVKTLRTIDFKGGLDNFLLGAQSRKLTARARTLSYKIKTVLEKKADASEEKIVQKGKRITTPKKRLVKKINAREALANGTSIKKIATKPKAPVKKAPTKKVTAKKEQ